MTKRSGTHHVSIDDKSAQSPAILLTVRAGDTVVFSGPGTDGPKHLRVVNDGVARDAIAVPAPDTTTGLWSVAVNASVLHSSANAVRVVIEGRFAPKPKTPAPSDTSTQPYRDSPPESDWKPSATLIVIGSTRKTATNLAMAPSVVLALIVAIQLAPIYRIASAGTLRNMASVLACATITVASRVVFRTSFRWWNHSIAYALLGSILCLMCFLHQLAESRALIVFSANPTVARHFGPVGGVAFTTQSELTALLPQIRAEGASILPNEMVHECEMPRTPGYQATSSQSIACDDRWLMLPERIQLAIGIAQSRERSTGCVDVTGSRCRAPLAFHDHGGHARRLPWTIALQVASQRESENVGVIHRPSVHGQVQFERTHLGMDPQTTRLVHFHVQNTSSLRLDRAESVHSDFVFRWEIGTPPAATSPMVTDFTLHAILAPGTPLLRLHSGSTTIEVPCERSEELDVVLTDIDPRVIGAVKVGDQAQVLISPGQRQLALCTAHSHSPTIRFWIRQQRPRETCESPQARQALRSTALPSNTRSVEFFEVMFGLEPTPENRLFSTECAPSNGLPLRVIPVDSQRNSAAQWSAFLPSAAQQETVRRVYSDPLGCSSICTQLVQPDGTSLPANF